MMMNKVKIAPLILSVILFFGCTLQKTTIDVASVIGTDSMKTDTAYITVIFDPQNPESVIAAHSYVFIGEVIQYVKTDNQIKADIPFTTYSVRVIENLKGALKTDQDIEIKKLGGLKQNSDIFEYVDGDILPKVGETYLFAAYVGNVELLCCGPGTTYSLPGDLYVDSETYRVFKETLSKPITIEFRSLDLSKLSKYDINYNSGE